MQTVAPVSAGGASQLLASFQSDDVPPCQVEVQACALATPTPKVASNTSRVISHHFWRTPVHRRRGPGTEGGKWAPVTHRTPCAPYLQWTTAERRARSSVGERSLHTREVAGSTPAAPIIIVCRAKVCEDSRSILQKRLHT